MIQLKRDQKIYWTFRIAVAMCFIGHGAFGIITKAVWCNYFAVVGIGKAMAYQLMPVVGTADIMMGLVFLVRPLRGIALWLLIWGIHTALLRPISGEPFAEFIERAGNYGIPFCFLWMAPKKAFNLSWLFAPVYPQASIPQKSIKELRVILRVVVFLLLTGHGLLNLVPKISLVKQYGWMGFSNPAGIAYIAGIFEIMAAITLCLKPNQVLVIFLIGWKMASELFYPQYALFEWIERGGSYAALVALLLILKSFYPGRQGLYFSSFS